MSYIFRRRTQMQPTYFSIKPVSPTLNLDMNGTDYDKRTALHLAAAEGHVETVRFLVEVAKAKFEIKSVGGN